jgi:hypothetical protein
MALSGTRLVGAGSPRGRVGDDFYATPFEATKALLNNELFEGTCLEPAAGQGHISKVLIDCGHATTSSDLVTRRDRYNVGIKYGIDFLHPDSYPESSFDNVITNPPYAFAEEFAWRALRVAKNKVALLCKIQFLEGQKRGMLFDTTPLQSVLVFRKRINPLRDGLEVDETGKPWNSTMCFAWFVWAKGWRFAPLIRWI